jgi:transposase
MPEQPLSQSARKPIMSRAEIRAVYAQGEEAVIELVEGLLQRIEALETRLEAVEGRLSKNSKNSSQPPSGDGFVKRTKSLRDKSGKQSGGQPEHPGHTLEWRDEVDEIIEHRLEQCAGCGGSLATTVTQQVFARQVHDIPEINLRVLEHQVEVKCCEACGLKNESQFPETVSNVVQYGSRLKGVMVYLMEGQLLPSARTVEVLKDVLGVEVSGGTLYNARAQCSEELEPITEEIKAALLATEVIHFDETGLRVNGKLWWLHVASSSGLTYYFIHPKRGRAAMDAMGILLAYGGKAIHDGWQSYFVYACAHFLCNAHHLRELRFILERDQQSWAFQMSLLLVTIYGQVEVAKAAGQRALPPDEINAFESRYQAILVEGFEANPKLEPPSESAKPRGRPKQSPARNLLERLRSQSTSVLGFMNDFEVPFDNNQAERDVRMMKLKQKISGSFRSSDGAIRFARIRGYLSTLRKRGHNVLDALIALFSRKPQPLWLQPD